MDINRSDLLNSQHDLSLTNPLDPDRFLDLEFSTLDRITPALNSVEDIEFLKVDSQIDAVENLTNSDGAIALENITGFSEVDDELLKPDILLNRQADTNQKQLVFIDSRVEDYEALLTAVPEAEVFLLESNRDGIEQIGEILRSQQEVSAVHLISHGASGSVQLGNTELNSDTLTKYQDSLQQWGTALTIDADLLLYGCNVAQSESTEFIQEIGTLTTADVAASDDLTGSSFLGGDWQLEYATGAIESEVIKSDYDGVLAAGLTVNDIYVDWQDGSLPSFKGIEFSIDNNSMFQGNFAIAKNDSDSLKLTGANLDSFIGTGLDTAISTDDVGLGLSNIDFEIEIFDGGAYSYSLNNADVEVVGIDGLELAATGISTAGDNNSSGFNLDLDSANLKLGTVANLNSDSVNFEVTSDGDISFSGSGLNAFAGYGADTPDSLDADGNLITDDVGLKIDDADLDLQVAADGSYSFDLSNASAQIRGIEGLVVDARQVGLSGDKDNLSASTGSFALGLDNLATASGDSLAFAVTQTQSGKEVSFNSNNSSLFVGYGANTETTEDNTGLSIANADVDITLKADASYEYKIDSEAASLTGIDGVTLQAGAISASGDADNLDLQLDNAQLGLKDALDIKANLAFKAENTLSGTNISLLGSKASTFIGYGTSTPNNTADDVGLAIANADFDLQLNADRSYSYDVKNAAVDVRGIDGVSIAADAVSFNGDDTGNKIEVALDNARLGVDNLIDLSGSFDFTTEGIGAEKSISFNGEDISAFTGYGVDTPASNDDIGLKVNNADFNLFLDANRTYSYNLANAGIEILGIPDLTLAAGAVNLSGDNDNTKINLVDTNLKLGDSFGVSGGVIDFEVAKTAAGQTLNLSGEDLAIFAGYGTDTPDNSDDVGLQLQASLSLVVNEDKTYSYSVSNAGFKFNGN